LTYPLNLSIGVGKDFRKWENGGERYYHDLGEAVTGTGKACLNGVDESYELIRPI